MEAGIAVGDAGVAAGACGAATTASPTFEPAFFDAGPHGACGWRNTLIFNLRSCAAALWAGFVFISSAAAQAPSSIVITGSREPVAAERLAADVVVITRELIIASPADSVADLLRREAGLQISRNGGPGQNGGVFIRGAASGQTVVLIDGVRIGSATVGATAFETLSLAQIDRIEILRGPGSSLYGADAVGGVVQVFTRRGEGAPRFDGHATVGGLRSSEVSAGFGTRAGAWDLAASVSREASRGVSALRAGDLFGNHNPDADGYALSSVQAQIGLSPVAGQRIALTLMQSRLNSQYDASEFLPPTFAQDASADFHNRQRIEATTLGWRGDFAGGLTATARASRSVDDSRLGGRQVDQFRTRRDFFAAQIGLGAGSAGRLVAAVEQHTEAAASTSFASDVQRRTHAAVLSLNGAREAWSWLGDLRHDRSSDYGGVSTLRFGGALALSADLRLRALAGQTFKAPSFNDLYYPGYGVATLQPERGRSVEIGLDWRGPKSSMQATVYLNRVRALIGYEANRSLCPPDAAYDFGCARNIARARMFGAAFSAMHRIAAVGGGALDLSARLDLLDATDADSGTRLTRRAAHQAHLGVDWAGSAWSFGAALLRVGARPDGGKQLAAETTLDLHSRWRFAPRWLMQAKLLNATDVDREPLRDYQGLGRQASIGLRYEGGL